MQRREIVEGRRSASSPVQGHRGGSSVAKSFAKTAVIASVLAASVGLSSGRALAQMPNLAELRGSWIPASDLSVESNPMGVDPAVDVELAAFEAVFNVPIKLTDKAVLLAGARYVLLRADQSNADIPAPDELELHALGLSLLFNYRFATNWDLVLNLAPDLSGDFVRVDGDHFRMGGGALVSYAFSPRFAVGAGALVGWQFGELRPLPALRIGWQITDSLRFDGFFPLNANLIWSLHDRFELGVTGSLRGQSFSLTSNRVQGRWPCSGQPVDDPLTPFDETQADSDRCFTNLAYSQAEAGPTIGIRITHSLWFTVRAGFLFFRRYEFLNEAGGTPETGDLVLDPNVIVQGQLVLRIPEMLGGTETPGPHGSRTSNP